MQRAASVPDDEQPAYDDLFREPAGFYRPPAAPSFAEHRLAGGESLAVRLVGHSPLWGHHLWNAGRTLATHLEQQSSRLVAGRSVLELGAGAGLPSLVAAVCGADTVVVTDYPDAELVENLEFNIENNPNVKGRNSVRAEGYLWGAPVEKLLAHLRAPDEPDASGSHPGGAGFDTLILGDLLFNHSEHGKLLDTVRAALKRSPDAVALVFFTPYRPWLLERDLAFFGLARESGFRVDKTFEKVMDRVMFEGDPGDELLRRTVYGYELRWPT